MISMVSKMGRNLAIGLLLATTATGCNCADTRSEMSDIIHEDARVANRVFTPSRHDTELEFSAFNTGSFGVSYSGNPGLHIGNNLQVSSVEVPEKYAVVFECQHGGFISQGSDLRHQSLYEKLKGVGVVDVTYRELFKATYQDLDKDGKKELTSRVLVGYDFLDAVPR